LALQQCLSALLWWQPVQELEEWLLALDNHLVQGHLEFAKVQT
jgi:hypothetical protein